MNSTISLTSLNQANGNKICCICLEKKSVDIPIINCDHRYEFCNECIIQWLAMKKFDCPICRKVWQEKECVSRLGGFFSSLEFDRKQTFSFSRKLPVKMMDISLYHSNHFRHPYSRQIINHLSLISESSIRRLRLQHHELVDKCIVP